MVSNLIIIINFNLVLYWQAPYQVRLTDVNTSALTISWTPVESICSFVSYNIISDQCGTCNVTSDSRAVCANFRLPSVCNFSIQYVVCGQAGAASNPISVNLAGNIALHFDVSLSLYRYIYIP